MLIKIETAYFLFGFLANYRMIYFMCKRTVNIFVFFVWVIKKYPPFTKRKKHKQQQQLQQQYDQDLTEAALRWHTILFVISSISSHDRVQILHAVLQKKTYFSPFSFLHHHICNIASLSRDVSVANVQKRSIFQLHQFRLLYCGRTTLLPQSRITLIFSVFQIREEHCTLTVFIFLEKTPT